MYRNTATLKYRKNAFTFRITTDYKQNNYTTSSAGLSMLYITAGLISSKTINEPRDCSSPEDLTC